MKKLPNKKVIRVVHPKVLCVLPLPRLVDTLRGSRIVYTQPDGSYSDCPYEDTRREGRE